MLSRRHFLQGVAGVSVSASGLSAIDLLPAAETGRKSQPDVVVHDGTYPGWPWVTTSADGKLYCVFREGTVHMYSAVGRVMLTTSSDGGKNWTPARVIIDEPGIDDRNVAIVELPNKDLLVTYNTYTKDAKSQAMTSRSTDGGQTWSKPRPAEVPNTRTQAAAHVLADGSLVWPFYVAPGNGAYAGYSTDNGQTWSFERIRDTDGFIGDEWSVVELSPRRVVGILRNAHRSGQGRLWKTESRDGGRTWDVPRPTNLVSTRHAAPAHIFLQGKTPTVVYADRRMVSVSAARTRDPELLKWDIEGQLSCYSYNSDDSPIRDGSYAVSAPVGQRQRIIVDYEIRPDSQRVTGYFVTFPESW